MKNTRYVKVTVSFVLCYDEPLEQIPDEMGYVDEFLLAGVEAAFIAKTKANRAFISVCPYAKLTASLIHAPRSLPQMLAQTQDQIQTFLTRKQLQLRSEEVARLAKGQEQKEAEKVDRKRNSKRSNLRRTA